ncbi:MAG: hypothetical protein M1827_001364 [Pycnora praestabilis]|nr:MAG: hypothetical protein M1827_001364 [Pycnora praestabilis]
MGYAVDSCTDIFMSNLQDFASASKPVDLGVWLQYWAFDVVGEIIFAKKIGFLDQGNDVDGVLRSIHGITTYPVLVGQVPEAHKLLLGNPLIPIFLPSMESFNKVLQSTLKTLYARGEVKPDGGVKAKEGQVRKDMLSRWLAIKQGDPPKN